MDLSITICTYNRSMLLRKCLESLILQIIDYLEILIIDNNSTDDTFQVVFDFTTKYKNIKYYKEEKTGLSHARNRGIQEAKTKWIAFLDDDMIVSNIYINQLIESIKSNYDVIGGPYKPFSNKTLPKWIPDSFEAHNPLNGEIQVCPYTLPHGGNVVYKREMLLKVGNFDPKLGMSGKKVAYGEETDIQRRIANKGGTFAFNPKMMVYHFVRPEKLSVYWILLSKVANGRDSIGKEVYFSYFILTYKTLRSLFSSIVIRLPNNLLKLVIKSNYFYQNFIIDTIGYLAFLLGCWKGKLLKS